MQKINEIWIPDEDVVLSTDGLKQWLLFCKLQNKKFRTVLDTKGEYGIWSRSMRNHAKKIMCFEDRKKFVQCCEKNTQHHNNIDFRQQLLNSSRIPPETFSIDSLDINDLDLIRVDATNVIDILHGAAKTLGKNDENQSNVKFLYVSNYTTDADLFVKSLHFLPIIENAPDRIYYR